MTSLLDVVPQAIIVNVGDTKLPVQGITMKGVAFLLNNYPEVKKLLDGDSASFTVERLFQIAPQAVAAIIADATGHAGEAKHIEAAAKLGIGHQVAIVAAAVKATMPDGVGPFLEDVKSLRAVLGNVVGTTDQDTNSQS